MRFTVIEILDVFPDLQFIAAFRDSLDVEVLKAALLSPLTPRPETLGPGRTYVFLRDTDRPISLIFYRLRERGVTAWFFATGGNQSIVYQHGTARGTISNLVIVGLESSCFVLVTTLNEEVIEGQITKHDGTRTG